MKIALVNSRKPRAFHPDESWLAWTMALAQALACQGHTLCTSVGTIGYDLALFGAAKGQGILEVFAPPQDAPSVPSRLPREVGPSNLVTRIVDATEVHRDRIVIDAADLVIAVAIRAGGHMETLLRERFQSGKKVCVVEPPEDKPMWRGTKNLAQFGVPTVAKDLAALAQNIMLSRASRNHEKIDWGTAIRVWHDAPLTSPTLAHYTRAAPGPWPGQSYREYLEDLWRGGLRARRDAPAALSRIVQSSKLLASGRLIRGRFPVVSFTAVSPDRIGELHRYRAHLLRWDFEPWGIVFDRDWLIKQHARPVHYLSNHAFQTLFAEERPWFQKHEPPDCDYSGEEEWRVSGDVDFSAAPSEAVRLVLGSAASVETSSSCAAASL